MGRNGPFDGSSEVGLKRLRRKGFFPALALGAVAAGASATAGPAEPSVQILQLATYAAEVRIEPDATWWGLYPVDGAFELREASPTLTEVPDPFDHGEEGRKALQVSVAGDVEPLFLFEGLPGARAGRIPSVFPSPRFLYPGEIEILTPGWTPAEPYGASGELLRLGAIGEVVAADHGPSIRNYALLVYRNDSRGGQRSQPIARFETPLDEFRPVVYWAGDLDRDGTADVIVDLSDDPMQSKTTLFLSSASEADQILAPVAQATSAQY